MTTKRTPEVKSSDIEKLRWELLSFRYLKLKNETGHRLYEGRFLSEVVRRRRGRFECRVLFYARHPRKAVTELLAGRACPADLHGAVLD
jgi:hypothetical protein